MSTTPVTLDEDLPVIEWDLIDRLHKSLRLAHLKPGQMATTLEVHRNTVSHWLTGKARPSRPAIRAWAAICSETAPMVTYEWLTAGEHQMSRWILTGERHLNALPQPYDQELPWPTDRPLLAAVGG